MQNRRLFIFKPSEASSEDERRRLGHYVDEVETVPSKESFCVSHAVFLSQAVQFDPRWEPQRTFLTPNRETSPMAATTRVDGSGTGM